MTKILYIITQSEFGGSQRYVLDLARNLDKSQYDIHIAIGGISGELFDLSRGQNLAVHSLKHLIRPISPMSDIKAYFEIKKLITEIKPDIVHLNSSKAAILGSMAAKKLGVPKIIYTVHGFVFNEPMNPIKRWIYTQAELGNAKRADRVIAVSEFDRQTGIKAGIFAQGGPASGGDKLVTIHNGIDTQNINFLPRDDARSKLYSIINHSNSPARNATHSVAGGPIPQFSTPLIGCVANFYSTKTLDVLIRAMTNIDAQLVIIGDGELRPQLEDQIKKLNLSDRVTLAGSIPDAHQYLKAFDLFVLPSRKEGFPYVLLEAAASRTPIVATEVGGIPEIIQDSVTGYLAQPDNAENLAQKISQALARPLAPQLPDDCNLQRMVEKTLAVYQT